MFDVLPTTAWGMIMVGRGPVPLMVGSTGLSIVGEGERRPRQTVEGHGGGSVKVRRVVTGHTAEGKATVASDT